VLDVERVSDTRAFRALRAQILELAQLRPSETVLDLGAGTGLLSLAAAPLVRWVHAVDVSPAMCVRLARKLAQAGIGNVSVLQSSAVQLPLADSTVDVAISNYCFHHLTKPEKMAAIREAMRVLRPGGRLVFADMMFRIGVVGRRDRIVICRFARRMLARGPAGLLRLLKHVTRSSLGRGEHPASVQWWREALTRQGFAEVAVNPLAHEGGIAFAQKPLASFT
jgi:ubiquinone/menaquinone biosynthesis C-methylase UbiE